MSREALYILQEQSNGFLVYLFQELGDSSRLLKIIYYVNLINIYKSDINLSAVLQIDCVRMPDNFKYDFMLLGD